MKKLLVLLVYAILAMPLFAQSWSKDLEKAAKAGNVEAQLTVGNAYLRGDGVKQNTKKAVKWLFMAAQSGNSDAVKSMCTFYSKELEQIAAAGNANAQFALGNFYAEGNGVEQNIETAFNWYGDAAAQGYKEAKPKVLGSYNPGIVKLAKAGDVDAASQVADFLFMGNGGATKNESEAAPYYAIAYKAGNKSAGTKLTTMYNAYLTGKGVPKNENLGYLYLANAAAAGIDEAKEKFYLTDTPYLEERALKGDTEAKKALAKLRGGKWYLQALDECENKGQLYGLYKAYDKNKMSIEFTGSDGQKVKLDGYSAIMKWAFDLPIDIITKGFNQIDFNNVKILSPNVAYLAYWFGWFDDNNKANEHILIKRLMNEFNNEYAKQVYDNEHFQYDYQTYDIGIIDHRKIVGFTGLDNVVMIDGKKYNSEALTADELKMLVDSLPQFAVNPEAVRVIRKYSVEKNLLDIIYLPGLIAYGPKSIIRNYEDEELLLGGFYDASKEFEITKLIVNTEIQEDQKIEFVKAHFGHSRPGNLLQITDVTKHTLKEYKINGNPGQKPYLNTKNKQIFYSATIDGQIVELELYHIYNYFWPIKYKIDGKENSVCRIVNTTVNKESFKLAVNDNKVSIEKNDMNQNHEFSDIEDFHSNEFYSSYGEKFVELSYLRPDGSLKRYIFNPSINADISVDYSKLKENLSPEYIETLIKKLPQSYCLDNSAQLYYGMSKSEYDKFCEDKKTAENNAKWDEFWTDLNKEFGKGQVDKWRNGKKLLQEGIDVRLLERYCEYQYSRFNNDCGSVQFYKRTNDGYGIYIFWETWEKTHIWTKNYKITGWTTYKRNR